MLRRKPQHMAQFLSTELATEVVMKSDLTLLLKGQMMCQQKLIVCIRSYVCKLSSYFSDINKLIRSICIMQKLQVIEHTTPEKSSLKDGGAEMSGLCSSTVCA